MPVRPIRDLNGNAIDRSARMTHQQRNQRDSQAGYNYRPKTFHRELDLHRVISIMAA